MPKGDGGRHEDGMVAAVLGHAFVSITRPDAFAKNPSWSSCRDTGARFCELARRKR
jgi:hypothetical protein